MADQLEKTEEISKGENDSSTCLFEDAYSKPEPVSTNKEVQAKSEPNLPKLSIETEAEKKSDQPNQPTEESSAKQETEQEKEARSKREKEIEEDPVTQKLLSSIDKLKKTGTIDEEFNEAVKAFAEKAKDNPEYRAVLAKLLSGSAPYVSVSESGISFRSEQKYLGGTDSIGHPAIPYGISYTSLTIPFDGSPVRAAEVSVRFAGGHDSHGTPIPITQAFANMFPPPRWMRSGDDRIWPPKQNPDKLPAPSRFDGQLYPYDGSGPKPETMRRPHDAHRPH